MNKQIIQIESITADDLQNRFNRIESMLNAMLNGYKPQVDDELMTTEQVCKLLDIDRSTAHLWRKKGILSAVGISNRVYFRKSDILNALVKL